MLIAAWIVLGFVGVWLLCLDWCKSVDDFDVTPWHIVLWICCACTLGALLFAISILVALLSFFDSAKKKSPVLFRWTKKM